MRERASVTASGSDVLASILWGLGVAGILILGISFGSRGFKDYDPALVPYTGAAVFSAFGIAYRYSMWLRRPPTRRLPRIRLEQRGDEIFAVGVEV
jgi:hypothetical protein